MVCVTSWIKVIKKMFQNKNKDSGNNINDLLSFLGSSSLGSQKKPSLNLDSMNSKKSTSSTICVTLHITDNS